MDIQCPQCGARFKAPDRIAGRKARCGACKAIFEVSALARTGDEYELERPLEEVVASRPRVPVAPPRRLPPDDPEDEAPLSPLVRCVVFVGEYVPGLFRPKVLILSVLCALVAFAILGLCVFVMLLGAVISAFAIGGFGLICYAQALGMLLHGEVAFLSEALSELNAWKWVLFILLLVGPFVLAFTTIMSRLAGQ